MTKLKKISKIKPKAEIIYPPVTRKEWIPPYLKPHKKRSQKYVKPEGLSQKLNTSSLRKVWHGFTIYENVGILEGHFSQFSKKFSIRSNGHQSAANCAVACFFAQHFPMKDWTSNIIDDILNIGNNLYLTSIKQKENLCQIYIPVERLYNCFYFENSKVTLNIDLYLKVSETVSSNMDAEIRTSISAFLKKFFETCSCGIFIINRYKTYAIWSVEDGFFYFNPFDNLACGLVWEGKPGEGVAIVIKAKTIENIVNHLFDNIPKSLKYHVAIVPCKTERIIPINLKPPETIEEVIPSRNRIKKTCEDEILRIRILQRYKDWKRKHPPPPPPPPPPEPDPKIKEVENQFDEFSPDVNDDISLSKRPSWMQEFPNIDRVCDNKLPEKRRPEKLSFYIDIVPEKYGILRGNTSQLNPKFSRYKGKQSFANALAAFTMLRIYKSKDWTPKTVNTILKYGDIIYNEAERLKSLKGKDFSKIEVLDYPKKIVMENKIFSPDIVEYGLLGKLQSTKTDVLDLGPALDSFLMDNQCCVICGPCVVAVWSENGRFYLFDPNNRDENGKRMPENIDSEESESIYDDIEAKEEAVPVVEIKKGSKKKRKMDEEEDEEDEDEEEDEEDDNEESDENDESEEEGEENYKKKHLKINKHKIEELEKAKLELEEKKKKEDAQNKYFEEGVACIIWFALIKDLVSHYINNLDINSKEDIFHLSSVQINDYVEIAEDWNNFKGISLNKWILQGSISQNDRQFEDRRNFQCSAIALIALGFAKVKHVKMWTSQTIDAIVSAGDELYKSTIERLQKEQSFKDKALMLSELNKQYIHEKVTFNFIIEDCKINGLINAMPEDDNYDLEKGLLMFFSNNKYGIVSSHKISVAIFIKDGIFYCFDSHSRDNKGLVTGFGTACTLRMLTLPELSKVIEANLSPHSQDIYNINKVDIEIIPKLLGITQAPLNNYTSLNLNTSILRATGSSKSEKYKTASDKQIIPMCLTALGFNKLWPSNMWNIHDIDEILDKGNDYYIESMIFNDNVENSQENDYSNYTDSEFMITTDNVKKTFNLGINELKVNFEVLDEGNIHDKLQTTLRSFYDEPVTEENPNQELILESQPLSVSIWRDDKSFFVFDPRPRDQNGQVIGKEDWSEYIPTPFDYSDGAEEFGYSDVFKSGSPSSTTKDETEEDDDKTEMDEDMESNPDISEDSNEDGKQSKRSAKSVKSKDFWYQQEINNGFACVMKFNTLFSLIDYIIENIPPNARRNLNFTIKKVELINKPTLKAHFDPVEDERTDVYSGNWFNFSETDYGKWCLRGTINLYNELFPTINRGKQALPMSVVALAFAFIYPLRCFKAANIDRILQYGDKLFTYVLKKKKEDLIRNYKNKETRKADTTISDNEIARYLVMDTFKLEDLVNKLCMVEHLIELKYERYCKVGDINAKDDQEEVLTLKKAIYDFFNEGGKYGILQAKDVTVAIWKGEKIFYMFDPFNRGPNGLIFNPGVACITRYLKLDDLSETFLNNLSKLGRNTFFIHKFFISKGKCSRQRVPNDEPPFKMPNLGGYRYIVPGKHILRGTRYQENTKYQPIPLNFSSPIAIIALTMSLIHKPNTWSKPIVDEILDVGYDLYNASVNELGFDFNPWQELMDVYQVKKDYNVGVIKANCELRHTDQIGIIDTKDENVQNLRVGIRNFFEENTHGILVTEPLTLAIWEQQEENEKEPLIYMYDPNSRGPLGMPCTDGTACVMVFVNATIAAEHIINCIVDPEYKKGDYRIIPVEIVIGKMKNKVKESNQEKTITTLSLPRCSKIAEREMKKRILQIAERERKEKQMKKLFVLGRKCWHKVGNGEFLIRGTRSQNSSCYCKYAKGKQDIPNCIASIIMHGIISIDNWNFKHIDLVLDTGNQVYVDSYIAYSPKDPKLGMKNIVRTFFLKNVEVHITVYKSIITAKFTQNQLNSILFSYFERERFCIINVGDIWMSIILKSGYYYLFDPHDHDEKGNKIDENGCAIVVRFDELPLLTEKLLNNLKGIQKNGNFTIWLIDIANIKQ